MVLSVIAGALIVLTLLAAVRLLFRQNQAQELAVGSTISEETAAPIGAWAGVGVLAALALVAGFFAWGRPQGPPNLRLPRTPPAAEAPQTPAQAPAQAPAPPPAARSGRGGLQGFLDWLRPQPRPPAAPKDPETTDTPADVTAEPPPPDEGKPGAPGQAEPPKVTAAPPVEPPPAPAPAQTGAILGDPVWIHRPGPEDIARFYPEGAKGRAGAAIIECQVGRMGRLRACALVLETPRGQGFGAAALRLAYRFRMRETSRTGEPTFGRTVRVPVAFTPSA